MIVGQTLCDHGDFLMGIQDLQNIYSFYYEITMCFEHYEPTRSNDINFPSKMLEEHGENEWP